MRYPSPAFVSQETNEPTVWGTGQVRDGTVWLKSALATWKTKLRSFCGSVVGVMLPRYRDGFGVQSDGRSLLPREYVAIHTESTFVWMMGVCTHSCLLPEKVQRT